MEGWGWSVSSTVIRWRNTWLCKQSRRMLTLTNSAAFERKQSCEKEITALSMTLTGNILLSKKEDIDTAVEDRDSPQDFLDKLMDN